VGLTADDAWSDSRLWGAGLGLRPLVWDKTWQRLLTLTADTGWSPSSGLTETWGVSLDAGPLAVRLWYSPRGTPQMGVSGVLRWGGVSALGSMDADHGWQAGGTISSAEGSSLGLPRRILRLSGGGTITSAPSASLPWQANTPSLPELLKTLRDAVDSPSIVGVVWENPPRVAGLPQAEALREAVQKLQHAGKPVWVYADDYSDALGFEGWISQADHIVLAPTGTLNLVPESSRRLYFKDLLDKWGLEVVNFAPWETKSVYNNWTFSSMPAPERAMLTRFLTNRQTQAEALLASGRGRRLKISAGEALQQGPWLVADDAQKAGLVDLLQSRSKLEDALTKSGAKLVDQVPLTDDHLWPDALGQAHVARVYLTGDIVLGKGFAGHSIGQDAVDTLKHLVKDNSIRAVVLEVDSPGGAVTPSDALAEQVKALVDAEKPVVVVMGDLAASGGYYLSAPASWIIARGTTLTGSIGVTAMMFSADKALAQWGIHVDGVTLGPSATFGSWAAPISDDEKAKWHGMILWAYDRFLDTVSAGRRLGKAVLEPQAQGIIYTGQEALKRGLVDEIGGDTQARTWLEKKLRNTIQWVDYVPGENNAWAQALSPLAKATLEASSPLWKAAESTQDLWGPLAQQWNDSQARGPGPQWWTDVR